MESESEVESNNEPTLLQAEEAERALIERYKLPDPTQAKLDQGFYDELFFADPGRKHMFGAVRLIPTREVSDAHRYNYCTEYNELYPTKWFYRLA